MDGERLVSPQDLSAAVRLVRIIGRTHLQTGPLCSFRCEWQTPYGYFQLWEPSYGFGTNPLDVFKSAAIGIESLEELEVVNAEPPKTDVKLIKNRDGVEEITRRVEKILACRSFLNENQYLIKWSGFSIREVSWEPHHNILDQTGLADEITDAKVVIIPHDPTQPSHSAEMKSRQPSISRNPQSESTAEESSPLSHKTPAKVCEPPTHQSPTNLPSSAHDPPTRKRPRSSQEANTKQDSPTKSPPPKLFIIKHKRKSPEPFNSKKRKTDTLISSPPTTAVRLSDIIPNHQHSPNTHLPENLSKHSVSRESGNQLSRIQFRTLSNLPPVPRKPHSETTYQPVKPSPVRGGPDQVPIICGTRSNAANEVPSQSRGDKPKSPSKQRGSRSGEVARPLEPKAPPPVILRVQNGLNNTPKQPIRISEESLQRRKNNGPMPKTDPKPSLASLLSDGNEPPRQTEAKIRAVVQSRQVGDSLLRTSQDRATSKLLQSMSGSLAALNSGLKISDAPVGKIQSKTRQINGKRHIESVAFLLLQRRLLGRPDYRSMLRNMAEDDSLGLDQREAARTLAFDTDPLGKILDILEPMISRTDVRDRQLLADFRGICKAYEAAHGPRDPSLVTYMGCRKEIANQAYQPHPFDPINRTVMLPENSANFSRMPGDPIGAGLSMPGDPIGAGLSYGSSQPERGQHDRERTLSPERQRVPRPQKSSRLSTNPVSDGSWGAHKYKSSRGEESLPESSRTDGRGRRDEVRSSGSRSIDESRTEESWPTYSGPPSRTQGYSRNERSRGDSPLGSVDGWIDDSEKNRNGPPSYRPLPWPADSRKVLRPSEECPSNWVEDTHRKKFGGSGAVNQSKKPSDQARISSADTESVCGNKSIDSAAGLPHRRQDEVIRGRNEVPEMSRPRVEGRTISGSRSVYDKEVGGRLPSTTASYGPDHHKSCRGINAEKAIQRRTSLGEVGIIRQQNHSEYKNVIGTVNLANALSLDQLQAKSRAEKNLRRNPLENNDGLELTEIRRNSTNNSILGQSDLGGSRRTTDNNSQQQSTPRVVQSTAAIGATMQSAPRVVQSAVAIGATMQSVPRVVQSTAAIGATMQSAPRVVQSTVAIGANIEHVSSSAIPEQSVNKSAPSGSSVAGGKTRLPVTSQNEPPRIRSENRPGVSPIRQSNLQVSALKDRCRRIRRCYGLAQERTLPADCLCSALPRPAHPHIYDAFKCTGWLEKFQRHGLRCCLCHEFVHFDCAIRFIEWELHDSYKKRGLKNVGDLIPESTAMEFVNEYVCWCCRFSLADPFSVVDEIMDMGILVPQHPGMYKWFETPAKAGPQDLTLRCTSSRSGGVCRPEYIKVFSMKIRLEQHCFPRFPNDEVDIFYETSSGIYERERLKRPAAMRIRKDTYRVCPVAFANDICSNRVIKIHSNFENAYDGPYLVAAVKLAAELTPECIIKAIQSEAKLSISECKEFAKRIIESGKPANNPEDSDDDLVIVTSVGPKIKLVCPSTMLRIDVPSRSQLCKHLQCFDLEFFVHSQKAQIHQARWKCPICRSSCRPHELLIDAWIATILRESEACTSEVTLRVEESEIVWEPSGNQSTLLAAMEDSSQKTCMQQDTVEVVEI